MAELKIPLTITKEMIKEAVKEIRETDWKESHNVGMLRQVENPDEVKLWDDMSNIIILVRDADNFPNEKVVKLNELKWRKDEFAEKEFGEEFMYITLADISDQITVKGYDGSIMVIYEAGLDGTIYRYGNHGDYWEIVGQLAGWA
jgi:hypothetical protein